MALKAHPKIPSTMATQHPDNATVPFWHNQAFISTQDEIEEMYQNFSELDVNEYMWDWEGKFADEAIFEKLCSKYLKFFQKKQVGKDIFITLRIPNIWEETTFKLARAYMSVLSAADFTNSLKLNSPPVFEIILPMTKSADQLIHIQETFKKTSELHQKIFSSTENFFENGLINIIPLFESIDNLADSAQIVKNYIDSYKKKYHIKPAYLRTFIARSDPALNAGFVPAVLASRMAIREFYRISKECNVPIYPLIGTGSLPFRGSVRPDNVDQFLKQYQGVKTFTVQSAFRYDYPIDQVKKAIKKINLKTKNPPILSFSDQEFQQLRIINNLFAKPYCQVIEAAAVLINDMAKHIPRRRERVQHVGLFGYNRGIGKTKLPRAITFTASWYSLGIPPEFIGTGSGLKIAKQKGLLPLIEKHFPSLRNELQYAGSYLNFENLEKLSKKFSWAKAISEDIHLCSEILKIQLGPKAPEDFIHRNLTSIIFLKKELNQDFSQELIEAAIIRKSLG